jgi:hypothetical protein
VSQLALVFPASAQRACSHSASASQSVPKDVRGTVTTLACNTAISHATTVGWA